MLRFLYISLLFFAPVSAAASCINKPYNEITSACTKAHSFIPAATTWKKANVSFRYAPLDEGHSWRGRWRNGEPIGFGIYKVEDKYQYVGMLRNRKPNGDGKLVVYDERGSQSFVGFFYDGHVNGTAKVYRQDWVYEGEVKKTVINGVGKMTLSGGTRFFGKFVDNQFVDGLIKYPNGDVYGGSAMNFKPHGVGGIWYDNLNKASGKFEDGWQVSGTLSYADQSEYEGEFLYNLPNGKGKRLYPDGSYTEGNYFSGSFVEGVYFKDGNKYTGTFSDGLYLLGAGEVLFKNGDIYRGETAYNTPNGNGKYTSIESATLYDGEWAEGKKSGKFRVLNKNQDLMFMGNYENDKKIGYWVTMNPNDFAANTGIVKINKYDEVEQSSQSLVINFDQQKVTICKTKSKVKSFCQSNSILEWEYIGKNPDTMTGLSFRKFLFEDDYLASNLRLSFNALQTEQKKKIIREVATSDYKIDDQSWSIKIYTFLAITAAIEHSTLNLNDKTTVEKVLTAILN